MEEDVGLNESLAMFWNSVYVLKLSFNQGQGELCLAPPTAKSRCEH